MASATSCAISPGAGFSEQIVTSQSYMIGVDTGGTYTDAAVIEAAGHKVIASAKALTTKGDLAIGVSEAIMKAIAALPQGLAPGDISLVSVSTTLATNAVVEGHGSPVGVILIGFDAQMAERTGIAKAFPGMPIALIAGGHDHNGDERTKLDLQALERSAAEFDAKVDAFAVAGAFAVRNPAHETAAREAITRQTGKPVTISSELSSALDAPRRALTAALNARLISRISRLIEAVNRAMKQLGIACPLMIVKGDGTLALAETVALRPIETVMSGPAASLVGARWLSGLDSFIMSDMGGTTTDLGVVVEGRLQIADEGAEIGGWRTMVKAADVRTVGLGGDSEVQIGMNGSLTVGPGRIVPLALIGSRFPETIDLLAADLADTEGGSMHGKFVLRPFGSGPKEDSVELSPREREIMEMVSDRPRSIRKIAVSSGAQRSLAGLRRKGLVQLCGFTPSDAAHVLDMQDNWSKAAAVLGAQLCARFRDMKAASPERARDFAQDVWNETVRLSARAVIGSALGGARQEADLVNAVCRGEPRIGFARIGISPEFPVVAVGGPVKIYYGEVGRRLACEVAFPEFCAVANAVGAATGVIARTIAISIEGDGNGVFRAHGPNGVEQFTAGAAALEWASKIAADSASEAVRAMGATAIEVRLDVRKHLLPDAVDDNGLLEAVVTAEAIGRPDLIAAQ